MVLKPQSTLEETNYLDCFQIRLRPGSETECVLTFGRSRMMIVHPSLLFLTSQSWYPSGPVLGDGGEQRPSWGGKALLCWTPLSPVLFNMKLLGEIIQQFRAKWICWWYSALYIHLTCSEAWVGYNKVQLNSGWGGLALLVLRNLPPLVLVRVALPTQPGAQPGAPSGLWAPAQGAGGSPG